jgi:hypothetical protein
LLRDPTLDSEAEQVQKCRAAAQCIFSRPERLCGYDLERVLAVSVDRDRHFALGKIRRRRSHADIGMGFRNNEFEFAAFGCKRTKNVERREIDCRLGERRAYDEFSS